jgi:hypothetical protein
VKIQEAIKATHVVYVGVEARTAKRRDENGRLRFLVTARGRYFHILWSSGKAVYTQVSQAFAEAWDDWQPQSDYEARKESAFMNDQRGLGLRNVILGLMMGPLPQDMQAPDHLPKGW